MKLQKPFPITIIVGCLLAMCGLADVPNQITFQGTLTDDNGDPITGDRSMQFSLYADSTGGTALWSELQWTVEINDGLFRTSLGETSTLPPSLMDGSVLWLGIQVSPDPSELYPRQPIFTIPYSFRSLSADHAMYADTADFSIAIGSDGDWTVSGDNVYRSLGNVGVGTPTPSCKLHVEGQAISGVNCSASGTLSTVSGGSVNRASGYGSIIAGGRNNIASDEGASILGGRDNTASDEYATAGGGYDNYASGYNSTISGGGDNTAYGDVATVGGGESNSADSLYCVVDGGYRNSAIGPYSTIGGGARNMARGRFAVVAGGGSTTASDSNSAKGDYSTVSGGRSNYARLTHTTISGGYDNYANDDYSVVGGGRENTAQGYSATVSGGYGNNSYAFYTTIGGGQDNYAGTSYSTIGGGKNNSASVYGYITVGGGENNDCHSTCGVITGGCTNRVDGDYGSVGGGTNNIASGIASTVPGGIDNIAEGDYTIAMGRRAQALHNGSFVWADGSGQDFTTTSDNQFLIRAQGGVGIGTNNPQHHLDVAGDIRATGNMECVTLNQASDIRFKDNIRTINHALEKVSRLRGVTFNWNKSSETIGATVGSNHVGIIAQEVESVFPQLVSTSRDGYKSVDYTKLTAVLIEAVKELKAQNQTLMERIEALEYSTK